MTDIVKILPSIEVEEIDGNLLQQVPTTESGDMAGKIQNTSPSDCDKDQPKMEI